MPDRGIGQTKEREGQQEGSRVFHGIDDRDLRDGRKKEIENYNQKQNPAGNEVWRF